MFYLLLILTNQTMLRSVHKIIHASYMCVHLRGTKKLLCYCMNHGSLTTGGANLKSLICFV
jgi:hypothetical protein